MESGQEARSSAFDRVNHQEFSISSALWALEVLCCFPPKQYVLVDGCRSKLVNVVLGVPQRSVLGPLLFLLYTLELFSILENKLIGDADASTLMAVVPSPGARVTVAVSLNRDLVRVNAWCDLWGMKFNASKPRL